MREVEYQEQEIKKLLYEMGSIFEDILMNREATGSVSVDEQYDLDSAIFDLENNFCYLADRVYKLCNVYFESKKLIQYLDKFNDEIQPILKVKKEILKGQLSDETDQVQSKILNIFWSYLFPFSFSENVGDEVLSRLTGLLYLEHILESTGVIIEDLRISPRSESQVYNAVKIVTKAVFPNVVFPSESFQKTAKCYKPDILLPVLNCAIEYKYADNETKLIETIDQILADVKGYEKHRTYRLFYAVFYVKNGIWTKSRFEAVWKEKKFPENWKWIYVQGNNLETNDLQKSNA